MTRDELLRKWVDALESDKYRQGLGALRVGDSYCCLGVLCDLTGEGRWLPPLRHSINLKDRWVSEEDQWGQTTELPPYLADLIGLTDAEEQELVAANDNGATFPQIARRIREMFPDVFTESVV